MNRRRRPGVHGGMNRPNHFMKQLVAQAAWLRAQGDDAGAAIADELADHIHDRHEGVDDQTAPEWANGPDVEVDNEPDIRCSPAVVHMGDVVRWIESRGVPGADAGSHCYPAASHKLDTVDGVLRFRRNRIINDLVDAASGIRAPGPMDLNAIKVRTDRGGYTVEEMKELYRLTGYTVSGFDDVFPSEDAEREAYDATVGSGYEGEVIDAEFEVTPDEVVAAQEAADPFNIDPPPGYGDAAALQAREDDRDYHARLLAEAEGSPYSEAVAGDEVEQNDDRMDARELDAQEDL